MTLRIFIAGDQGQLARVLVRAYSARGDVVASAGRAKMDIVDEAAVRSSICAFRPDLVINAAAYTAVDKAEDDADQAYKINCDGARHVAASASALAVPLIHISTDYVFDGTKSQPYVETDLTNPAGVYGQSKLAGEAAVAAETADSVILRTSWLFSTDGNNFVRTILRLADERDVIDVVDDQWGAPTFAADLATAIAAIGDSLLSATHRSALCGLYHATASGETTWYRFARAIMKISAAKGGPSCNLHPITTTQYPMRTPRPANSRLDGSKLVRIFGIRLPPWQTSLERCLDQLIPAAPGANA
jgi:dTDP-4-dehydrorhamnose reductase